MMLHVFNNLTLQLDDNTVLNPNNGNSKNIRTTENLAAQVAYNGREETPSKMLKKYKKIGLQFRVFLFV